MRAESAPLAVALTLPLPPSANSHWRHVTIRGSTRVLISAEGRRFREAVQAACAQQLAGVPTFTDALDVEVHVYMQRRGCDLDNRLKPLLDALTHARLWEDDAQVCTLAVSRLLDPVRPRVEVAIRPTSVPPLVDAWRAPEPPRKAGALALLRAA